MSESLELKTILVDYAYARMQGLKGVVVMEQEELVESLARDIDGVINDSKLKTFGTWGHLKRIGFHEEDSPFRMVLESIILGAVQSVSKKDFSEGGLLKIAKGQALIDGTLQFIAMHLERRLFPVQNGKNGKYGIRGEIKDLLHSQSRSVPRNLWCAKLDEENRIHDEVERWKKVFYSILSKAKELDFWVLERGEEQFKIYFTVDVSLAEIYYELQRQAVAAKANLNNKMLPLPAAYIHFG